MSEGQSQLGGNSGPRGRTDRPGVRLAAAALLLAAGAMFAYRGAWRACVNSIDWGLYYSASRAWLDGANPYSISDLRRIAARTGARDDLLQNSIAPPLTLVALAPLAALPWPTSKYIWLLLNSAAVATMVVLLLRWSDLTLRSEKGIVLAALVLGLSPIHTNVAFGQLAVMAVVLLLGAIRMQEQGRQLLTGLLLATGALLKPQLLVLFVLYWLFRRRWRAVKVATAVALIVTAVALGRLSLTQMDWLGHWRANVVESFDGGICDYAGKNGHVFLNLQFPVYQITGSRQVANAVAWVFLSGIAAAAMMAWRGSPSARTDHLLDYSLLGVVCLLPVYHVFYDASILVLPLAWAMRSMEKPNRRYALAVIALVLPFMVPGASAMHEWGQELGAAAQSWWWKTVLLPHQSYLLAGLSAVLLSAVFRGPGIAKTGLSSGAG